MLNFDVLFAKTMSRLQQISTLNAVTLFLMRKCNQFSDTRNINSSVYNLLYILSPENIE